MALLFIVARLPGCARCIATLDYRRARAHTHTQAASQRGPALRLRMMLLAGAKARGARARVNHSDTVVASARGSSTFV